MEPRFDLGGLEELDRRHEAVLNGGYPGACGSCYQFGIGSDCRFRAVSVEPSHDVADRREPSLVDLPDPWKPACEGRCRHCFRVKRPDLDHTTRSNDTSCLVDRFKARPVVKRQVKIHKAGRVGRYRHRLGDRLEDHHRALPRRQTTHASGRIDHECRAAWCSPHRSVTSRSTSNVHKHPRQPCRGVCGSRPGGRGQGPMFVTSGKVGQVDVIHAERDVPSHENTRRSRRLSSHAASELLAADERPRRSGNAAGTGQCMRGPLPNP